MKRHDDDWDDTPVFGTFWQLMAKMVAGYVITFPFLYFIILPAFITLDPLLLAVTCHVSVEPRVELQGGITRQTKTLRELTENCTLMETTDEMVNPFYELKLLVDRCSHLTMHKRLPYDLTLFRSPNQTIVKALASSMRTEYALNSPILVWLGNAAPLEPPSMGKEIEMFYLFLYAFPIIGSMVFIFVPMRFLRCCWLSAYSSARDGRSVF